MNTRSDKSSSESLKDWLIRWMADEMAVPLETIEAAKPLLSYGLNSVQAMTLVGDLETATHLRLPPTLVWDYPTIDALADHVANLGPTEDYHSAEAPSFTQAVSSREAEELLTGLDKLSDQEVDALLNRLLEHPTHG
jgi:acyl carrier protein